MSTSQCRNVLIVGLLFMTSAVADPVGPYVQVAINDGTSQASQSSTTPVVANVSLSLGSASGTGSANMTSGLLTAVSRAPDADPLHNTLTTTTVTSQIYDDISFSANATGIAYVDYHWDGLQSGYDGYREQYATLDIYIQHGNGQPSNYEFVLDNHFCDSHAPFSCIVGTSIDRTGSALFFIQPGATFIGLTLMANAADGGTVDFSDSAAFALRLPDGVSYTSTSGVFLATAAPVFPVTTVPEPSSIALIFMGLAIGMRALRGKRGWPRRNRQADE